MGNKTPIKQLPLAVWVHDPSTAWVAVSVGGHVYRIDSLAVLLAQNRRN